MTRKRKLYECSIQNWASCSEATKLNQLNSWTTPSNVLLFSSHLICIRLFSLVLSVAREGGTTDNHHRVPTKLRSGCDFHHFCVVSVAFERIKIVKKKNYRYTPKMLLLREYMRMFVGWAEGCTVKSHTPLSNV